MQNIRTLSWSERLAFIDRYQPSVEQITKTFQVTTEEVASAFNLREQKVFRADPSVDVDRIGNIFVEQKESIELLRKAYKRTKPKKRRGPKGNKIQDAFAAVPHDPTNAYEFIDKYGISLPVLRQAKRFDKTGKIGDIIVKQIFNPQTNKKELMVWREKND
jgi:hypothetical protein